MTSSFHRGILAEFGYILIRKGGWNKGRPDRTGRYAVDADSLVDERKGERAGESDHGSFSGRVVN